MRPQLLLFALFGAFMITGSTGCFDYGCTDPLADNYDPFADHDNGRCIYKGCTDPNADNYSPIANLNDGSCIYRGCTDINAVNYNPLATIDDGSCQYTSNGDVVFWSSVQCCAIQVTFNGTDVGNIEYYFASDPGCIQTQGTILVTVPAGTYNFTAQTTSGGIFTWNGTITVPANGCITHQFYL